MKISPMKKKRIGCIEGDKQSKNSSTLKEIAEFVNKVKNKQKESRSQAQVTVAVYIMKSLIPSMASKC